MAIEIVHLFERRVHLPLVAGWIYREFWADKPGYSVEAFVGLLGDASDPDRIPLSLLALWDGQPAGTVNLIVCDSQRRPHLTPWLAALVVRPEFRRRGIGAALVRRCCDEAKRLGYRELFLGTDIPAFYQPLGARVHESFPDNLCIMRCDLAGRTRDESLHREDAKRTLTTKTPRHQERDSQGGEEGLSTLNPKPSTA